MSNALTSIEAFNLTNFADAFRGDDTANSVTSGAGDDQLFGRGTILNHSDPAREGERINIGGEGVARFRAFAPPRVGLLIAGFEVPHVHLHVLPIHGEQDLHLDRSARSVDPDDLARNAEKLRAALRDLGADGVSD